MLDLYAELQRVVQALDTARVGYALVGGLAVSIYTTPRATEDIDLLIARHDAESTVSALEPLGFRPAGRPMRVADGRIEIQRLTKIAGTDVLVVDLVLPVDEQLATLVDDRVNLTIEGRSIWVVGLSGLRKLKRLRGAARDRADLEALGPE